MPAGRPLLEITPALCEKAETLAGKGLTINQIALSLGMGKSTLYDKKAEYVEFSDAIERGRAKGIETITNALFKNASEGDTVAQKYYLNNRDNDNWKDRIHSNTEHTGEVTHVVMSADEYKKAREEMLNDDEC